MEFTLFHVLNAQSRNVGKSTELTCLKSRTENKIPHMQTIESEQTLCAKYITTIE